MVRRLVLSLVVALGVGVPGVTWAAAVPLRNANPDPLTVVLLLGALSLLPFFLAVTTSFVKFTVVLSMLRHALGTPQVPPTIVITALSVILTGYVMAPTAVEAYEAAQQGSGGVAGAELLTGASARSLIAAANRAKDPLRKFLIKHSSRADRALFVDLAHRVWPAAQARGVGDDDMVIVVPAFVISQLAEAFKVGFLLFVPFVVIDMVVANVLLALGMHMLSPTMISMPFKLLLFVLVDGWHLLTQGLVLSYV